MKTYNLFALKFIVKMTHEIYKKSVPHPLRY